MYRHVSFFLELLMAMRQIYIFLWTISPHGDETRYAVTASHGRLDMLQLLKAKDCPWDSRTCGEATGIGFLEMLQWARRHGCPWDSSTCERAAANGHLDVLRWTVANGCSWDKQICRDKAIPHQFNKHQHIADWVDQSNWMDEEYQPSFSI